NIRDGLARASAVLILNAADNGYPFACMEGSGISAARTAASAVLAGEYLMASGRHARTLAVVGTGFIARYVYRFLLGTGWTIDRVQAYDINPSEAKRFLSGTCLASQHLSVEVMPDLASAVRTADLVLFATVVDKPHVHDEHLFDHRPVVLHLSLRDLAPEL